MNLAQVNGAAILFMLFTTGSGLMCYICGQSDLPPPGDCPTHFQYDCRHYAQRFQTDESIRCRTLRRRTDNGTYTSLKECIAESEHQLTYPSSISDGCEVLFEGTEYEISYCLCQNNFCNEQTIDVQLAANSIGSKRKTQVSVKQPMINQQSIDAAVIRDQREPDINIDELGGQSEVVVTPAATYFGPSILNEDDAPANSEPLGPVADFAKVDFDYYGPSTGLSDQTLIAGLAPDQIRGQQARTQEDIVDLQNNERPLHFQERPTSAAMKGLVCTVCGEGSLNRTSPECSKQYAVDCAAQYPIGSQVFCFTRHTLLTNGMSAIEKLCVTDTALIQEYGDTVQMNGCATAWQDQVEYCVCNTTMCNERSIVLQLGSDEPSVVPSQLQFVTQPQAASSVERQPTPSVSAPVPASTAPVHANTVDAGATSSRPKNTSNATTFAVSKLPTKFCYVCGESDLQYPTDCGLAYEYDCARQYPDRQDVLCLTRLSKMSNELFTIEKRCITPEEHRKQYPGNSVIMHGCGTAWDDYVQYCVCNTDYCNTGNISAQQTNHKQLPVTYNNMITEYAPPIALNQTGRDRALAQNSVDQLSAQQSVPATPRPSSPRRKQPSLASTAPTTIQVTTRPPSTTTSPTVTTTTTQPEKNTEQGQLTGSSSRHVPSFIYLLVIFIALWSYCAKHS